jgi:acetyl-CoA synthetase
MLDDLMARSTRDIAWFWDAVFEDLGIEFYEPYTQVVDLSRGIQWPVWCVGAKLNIVHNCVDRWINTPAEDRIALRWEGEEGGTRLLTYRDLFHEVNRASAALRAAGIGKGDAVGLFMPMIPEIVIALLAIARIGAVILPLFPGLVRVPSPPGGRQRQRCLWRMAFRRNAIPMNRWRQALSRADRANGDRPAAPG